MVLIVIFVEIEVEVEPVIGILRFEELSHLPAVALCGASQPFLAVDKAAYPYHFEQFILLGWGNILQIAGDQLRSHAVLGQGQNLE